MLSPRQEVLTLSEVVHGAIDRAELAVQGIECSELLIAPLKSFI